MKIEISTVVNGRETEAAVKPRPPKKTCRCRTYNEVLARIRNLQEKTPQTVSQHYSVEIDS